MNVVVMGVVMILMWTLFHGQGHHEPPPRPEPPGSTAGEAVSRPQLQGTTQKPGAPKEGTHLQKESQPKAGAET